MHNMDVSHITNFYTKEVRHKRLQFITFKKGKFIYGVIKVVTPGMRGWC